MNFVAIVILTAWCWAFVTGLFVPPHASGEPAVEAWSPEFERLRAEALAELDEMDRAFGLDGPSSTVFLPVPICRELENAGRVLAHAGVVLARQAPPPNPSRRVAW